MNVRWLALAHGDQLELHYQTQHSLKDGSLVGMEALMRWRHPRLGMVSPGDFIPLAERHGLMTPLGAWVIEQAASQLARWEQAGLPRVSADLACELFEMLLEPITTQVPFIPPEHSRRPSGTANRPAPGGTDLADLLAGGR